MLKAEKKVIGNLNKCYAVAKVVENGQDRLICAAEKSDPCYMFDTEGNQLEQLWDGPGGVMTLEQFPSDDFILMATWKFYSPNDSANAKIVYYTRENGGLKCSVLCDLPFVHRFGILRNGGRNYLIACTLKSAHAFKNDWTCPGRIWVAELPEDIRQFNADNQLQLTPLVSGLYRNHGFGKVTEGDVTYAVVGTDNGVYKVVPPAQEGGEWEADVLLEEKTSDMLYVDFDGDGERELLTLSPFHGDTLSVWKKKQGTFEKVWEYPEKLPFLHAIYAAEIGGKSYGIVGNREDRRLLLAVSCDAASGTYQSEILDEGAGPANVLFFRDGEQDKLIAANRETDEIALYTLKAE